MKFFSDDDIRIPRFSLHLTEHLISVMARSEGLTVQKNILLFQR